MFTSLSWCLQEIADSIAVLRERFFKEQAGLMLNVNLKPNSITLADSELAPNMFGASSEVAPNQLA